jgi:photosystem II stability/assembly factor-like uncharacterized protein
MGYKSKTIYSIKLSVILSFIILFSDSIYSQWFPQQTNTSCFISKIRMLNANTGYAIGDSSLVLKTTNGGINWLRMNTGTSPDDFFQGIHFLNTDTGWICGGYMGGFGTSKILKTENGGHNWVVQYSQMFDYFFATHFVDQNTGFTGGYDGTYLKTTNGGNNWTEYTVTGANIWTMQFFNNSTGFIAGNAGMIRKTTNGGINYTLMSSGTNLRIASIFFTDMLNGYAICDSETVLKTTNGGINWSSQRIGNDYVGYESVYFVNQNTGYAVGNWWEIATYKLIKTTNAGINWFTVKQGEGDPYFDIWFVNDNTGWIAGYNGLILKTTNASTTFAGNTEMELPDGYELYQNHPNPFNPTTNIKFKIPLRKGRRASEEVGLKGVVSLKIYDITGREIQTLVNEKLNPGIYEVTFDGSNLSSGVYFYTFSTGEFYFVKKMILLK